MGHRAAGESYNRIIRAVEEEFHVRLNKSHVSNWIRGEHVPDGSVTKFVPTPTAELGYVIGVVMGDGSMSICGDHNYKIKLRVTDRDFAQSFAEALVVVLKKQAPRVRFDTKTNQWHVDVGSLLLQQFLRRPVGELRAVIGQNETCAGEFLSGFFDSDGSAYGGSITASNTDLTLIRVVLAQLNSLGIATTGPYLTSKGGRDVTIKGRVYRANNDCFTIRVRKESRRAFLEKVGFKIGRKRQSVLQAIKPSNNRKTHQFAQIRDNHTPNSE